MMSVRPMSLRAKGQIVRTSEIQRNENQRTGRGLLEAMGLYNMECPRGHRHYAPRPSSFIGRDCLAMTVGARCQERLRRIN